jgi:hypothetical protein
MHRFARLIHPRGLKFNRLLTLRAIRKLNRSFVGHGFSVKATD